MTAKEWLLQRLSLPGPHLATNLLDEGEAAGYNRGTLLSARQKLPVKSHYGSGSAQGMRPGVPRAVVWYLDPDAMKPTVEDRLATLEAHVAQLEGRLAELDFLR